MRVITESEVKEVIKYPVLIEELRNAFKADINVPARMHLDYENPKEEVDSTLLLMPSWEASEELGIKILTVSPNNSKYNLPGISAVYLLFDAHKGGIKSVIEAKRLTSMRTAAASALASSYLSREDSKVMLMIGTGALCEELIRAHSTVRKLQKIYVWGRNKENALKIVDKLKDEFDIEAVNTIEEKIGDCDIISCATLSTEPLIKGEFIKSGQHYDLVGSFKPNMREVDDQLISNVDIFIDSDMAKKETGDLKVPLENGIISDSSIKADLFELTRKEKEGRTSKGQITLFKSVGHALEDFTIARLIDKEL
ncbi:MAG: ornithine cyclodeaminase [Arcobacter sp.]|nr:MAG: ornithine cyclodeaminase [Arcobacter sp.]